VSRGESATEVRIETVQQRDLVATVTASGQIRPKTSVDVASDITGRIVTIPVEEGQWVERGTLLLRIDPTQFEASAARAEAALSSARAAALQAQVNRDQARRALDRQLQLRRTDQNLVSDEQLEQSQQSSDVAEAVLQSQEHQVVQAEASVREAQEQLAKTTLRAPMAGRVTRMAVEEGEVALASTFSRETGLLMTISDLSVIQIDVRVDETDVVRLAVGDSSEVSIDAYPDTTFVGVVTRISHSSIQAPAGAAAADRAVDYDVVVTIENPPPDIRPDLSGTAKIITETRLQALSVPIIALTVREHKRMGTEAVPGDTAATDTEGVFVVQGGAAFFRPVTVGIAGEEHFEVISGLSAGDSIVAGPYQTIRELSDSTTVRNAPSGESSSAQS
jgi:HlyD family secretion protein